MSIKRQLIEKHHNNEVQIWKQSEKSYQGKIYLGWKGGKGGQPIYKYKTIKTDDISVVRKEIEKLYHKLKYELSEGIVVKEDIGQNSFIGMIKEYLNEFDWKNHTSHQNDGRFGKRILQWIKDEKIKKIDYPSLINLKEKYLPKYTSSSNTISHHFNFIRKVYRYHERLGNISQHDKPKFPTIKKTAGKRTYFTFGEYRILISKSIERMNEEGLARNVQLTRKTLNRFIIFMIGSGLRSDEGYNLKWDQIEHRQNKQDKFLRLDLSKSKTGPRTVITKPQCVSVLKELKKVYEEYEDEFVRRDLDRNKVFPFYFHSSLRTLLQSCNLHIDKSTGKKRDTKSFRQTYISWGVINGENITDLSKNCGNSVAVIEKYYIHNLTSKQLEERLSSLRVVK